VVDTQRWRERRRGVAVLAHIGRLDVLRILAERRRAVVTAGAVAHYACVVEAGGQPGCWAMTGLAIIARGWMVARLAAGNLAVMTRRAGAKNLRVIHAQHRRPVGRAMAVFAGIGGGDVASPFAARGAAVVATRAIARYARVVEARGEPGVGAMAFLALLTGGRVIGWLARCVPAVVAAAAAADHLRVVNPDDAAPGAFLMAVSHAAVVRMWLVKPAAFTTPPRSGRPRSFWACPGRCRRRDSFRSPQSGARHPAESPSKWSASR
jgi:hypothetical protein